MRRRLRVDHGVAGAVTVASIHGGRFASCLGAVFLDHVPEKPDDVLAVGTIEGAQRLLQLDDGKRRVAACGHGRTVDRVGCQIAGAAACMVISFRPATRVGRAGTASWLSPARRRRDAARGRDGSSTRHGFARRRSGRRPPPAPSPRPRPRWRYQVLHASLRGVGGEVPATAGIRPRHVADGDMAQQ